MHVMSTYICFGVLMLYAFNCALSLIVDDMAILLSSKNCVSFLRLSKFFPVFSHSFDVVKST
jgi:hypothetical protein